MTPQESAILKARLAGKPKDPADDVPLIRCNAEMDGFVKQLVAQGPVPQALVDLITKRRAFLKRAGR